jgi:hypothetical protein
VISRQSFSVLKGRRTRTCRGIGGQVLDPDGNPVAGATIGFNHEDRPETLTLPQNHRFSWVTAQTDATGHWTMTRIAEDMVREIYGSAKHPDYVGSGMRGQCGFCRGSSGLRQSPRLPKREKMQKLNVDSAEKPPVFGKARKSDKKCQAEESLD